MFKPLLTTLRTRLYRDQKFFLALWDKSNNPCPVGKKDVEMKGTIVPLTEVTRFIVDALRKVGTNDDEAVQMAHTLVMGDFKGHLSHGLNRLEMYMMDIKEGAIEPNAVPTIKKESPSTAYVCGNNGLGPVIGNYCMKLAINKAKNTGIGFIAARRSNHYGISSWYTDQALKHDLVSFCFSNTSPLSAPTNAKQKALGTNPMAFAAPGKDCDAFVMDMATTAVAVGKIELLMKRGEPIPLGWALGPDGNSTEDSKLAFEKGSLMPIGGVDHCYKGYALSLMVESLCGILADSLYGPFIRDWGTREEEANLGQCFCCICPEFFAPGYLDRMSCLLNYLRKMEPANPDKPVLIPGDVERNMMKKNNEQGGIMYPENQVKWANDFAKEYGIPPLKPKENSGDQN